MIVRRDFLDHWKTRKLRELLGYDHVSDHLIALWAHCEVSKRWRFPDNAEQMANICRNQDASPDDFCAALLKAGFLDRINGEYVVHHWDEHNKKLIHNWEVGVKGGRPRTHLYNGKDPKYKYVSSDVIRISDKAI